DFHVTGVQTCALPILVLERAYHGNLSALIDVSPYKFDGPGGAGRPAHTHVCTLPDVYRGRWRRGDPDAGERYAESVRDTVAALRSEERRVGEGWRARG